jgi:hypothetical protein
MIYTHESEYLRDHPGQSFCRACFGQLATEDKLALSKRGEENPYRGSFQEGPGVCSECHEQTMIIRVPS